ncbi:MAG: hypothetical protein DRN81_05745, partial [Thermoproteota archaeon]
HQGIDPAQYIFDKLKKQIQIDNLDIRIERLHQVVNDNTAKAVGEVYNATLVLWGWYDTLGITPQIERIKNISPYSSTEEGEHLSLSEPDKIAFCIITDLPSQASYVTLFTLGITEYAEKNYDQALTYFDSALAAIPTGGECSTNPAETYFYRGERYVSGTWDRGDIR